MILTLHFIHSMPQTFIIQQNILVFTMAYSWKYSFSHILETGLTLT